MNEYRPKINLRRSFLIIALVIALAGLAGWILKPQLLTQMFEAIRNANHPLIGLAIATYFFSTVLWTIRWQIALRSINGENPRPGFTTLFSIICSAIFLNNITPFARAGGDPFGRVYLVRRLGNVQYSTAIAASLGEHIFDPLILISFLLTGLFLRFGQGSPQLTVLFLVIGALVVPGVIIFPRFFLRKMIGVRLISNVVTRVVGWFGKRANAHRIIEAIELFYSSTFAVIDRRRQWLSIGGLTLLMWALDLLRLYIIFLALGHHPEIAMLLLASSLPTIVGILPFLPGGLVIIEGSLISIFVLFGVSLELATAATLIERGISFVLSSAVGAGIFAYLGVKMAVKRPELETEQRCA
jgi:glycosyltransferase 2 family protein